MNNIAEYTIAHGNDVPTLRENVMGHIKQGFQPIGGICQATDGKLLQAMVRHEGGMKLTQQQIEEASKKMIGIAG